MRPLQVDPVTIRTLAQRCRDWADDLATPAPPTPAESISAAAAAATAVQADVRAVAGALADRMRETADLLDEALRCYQADDAGSAARLGNAPSGR